MRVRWNDKSKKQLRKTASYIAILAKLLPQQPNADASLPAQRAKLLNQRPARRTSRPTLQSA